MYALVAMLTCMLHLTIDESPVTSASRPRDSLVISEKEITLGEKIGQGTFGEVYKGEWQGTEVAVKVIRLPENDLLEQCKREIDILRLVI